jgi:hypothetical protein
MLALWMGNVKNRGEECDRVAHPGMRRNGIMTAWHGLRATALTVGLALAGCGGDKAEELFGTAQFEEKQNNQEHARQLYEEIVKDYPTSETAKKAAERLSQLKQGQ